MNLQKLRELLDQLEAAAGTDQILVKVFVQPESFGEKHLNISNGTNAIYRDPGEVNHVIWLHAK